MMHTKRNIKEAVLALYRKHPTMRRVDMAARLGFPAASVSVVLQRAGLTKPPAPAKARGPKGKYHRLQDWERAAIEDAYTEGEKLEALAAEFDVDMSTISRVAERAGLPRRYPTGKIHMPPSEAKTFEQKRRRLKAERMARLKSIAHTNGDRA